MIEIHQWRYSRDNLAYLLVCDSFAVAIDGGAVDEIARFVDERDLSLEAITNTHGHRDHTAGNRKLSRRTGAPIVDHRELASCGELTVGPQRVRVIATPGHTMDSVVFETETALITGDTLFNATVGNCFSGDLNAFFASIQKLLSKPDGLRVYAGHDYVKDSIREARSIEPDNPHFEDYLRGYDPAHVVSTLGQERLVNPYLRFDEPPIIAMLRGRGLEADTSAARFCSLMG